MYLSIHRFNIKQSLSDLSYDELLSQFHMTQWSTVSLVKAFFSAHDVTSLVLAQFGVILVVRISSLWYAKASLSSLSRHLCHELAPLNILINTISPGFIQTKLTQASLEDPLLQPLFQRIPLHNLGDPSSVAELAYFLCSPSNSYITGQDLLIDGGITVA